MRAALVLGLVIAVGCSKNVKPGPTAEERLQALERQVEQQRKTSANAIAAYTPKVADRGIPAADLLRQLPGVAEVEVLVACPKPTHRIVHLRDWHFVPRDLY